MQQKVETEGQTEEISPWLSTDFQKEELELGVRSSGDSPNPGGTLKAATPRGL